MRWHIVWYVVNAFFLYYSNNMNHLFAVFLRVLCIFVEV